MEQPALCDETEERSDVGVAQGLRLAWRCCCVAVLRVCEWVPSVEWVAAQRQAAGGERESESSVAAG